MTEYHYDELPDGTWVVYKNDRKVAGPYQTEEEAQAEMQRLYDLDPEKGGFMIDDLISW